MGELVAVRLPGGPTFVEVVQRIWDAGDAVLPLDPAAPDAHTRRILAALAPGAIIDTDGERRPLPDGLPVDPDDAVVIATSGTTGTPKGAVHTHAGITAAARITAQSPSPEGRGVRWLACLPLAHVGGFSVITRALLNGADLEVHRQPDATRIDDAARRGATHVSLVPTLLRRIRASLWEQILLGGSAIPADRPANTVATYGMTETFGGVVYEGRPLDGVELRIADADTDGVGGIELRSPTLLRAYRHGTVALTPDGWYVTGDLGVLGSDGCLSVAGRGDDLIITGGVKVWPTAVEEALRSHPTVADVAVIGRPDPEWGQRVVAVVVPADRRTPPELAPLRDHVRERLPVAAAPKELLLTDVLPRTGLGKIERHALHPGSGQAGGIDDS